MDLSDRSLIHTSMREVELPVSRQHDRYPTQSRIVAECNCQCGDPAMTWYMDLP
jgi:hypothetical protein